LFAKFTNQINGLASRCPGLRFGAKRLANHNLVDRINAVDLKNALGQVEADRGFCS
jgi:hypothetical protein